MTSAAKLLILSFLIIGSHTVSSKKYTADDLIDDISPFIPGSKFVLKNALKIWKVYGKVKKQFSNSTDDLIEALGEEMARIDQDVQEALKEIRHVSKDIKDLKITITDKVIMDGPKVQTLEDRFNDFKVAIDKVNSRYGSWRVYNQSNIRTRNERLRDFAEEILSIGNPLNSELDGILSQILTEESAAQPMLNILTDKHLTNTLVCKKGKSPFYILSHLYHKAMKAFMKGMVLYQFATTELASEVNGLDDENDLLVERFYRQTSEIAETFKIFMLQASEAYWKCDPIDLQEGVTYAKLAPIFQTYFMKEKDAKDHRHECHGSCADRKNEILTDKCKSKFCRKQTACTGKVVECGPSKDPMEFCFADVGSGRRYHSFTTHGNDGLEVYGKPKKCRDTYNAQKYTRLYECEYCQCTCLAEDDNVGHEDRYFSLRNVTSDVDNNKVITGVRFAKENNIFHIQIEEGVLLENGIIDKNTTAWKPVDNFTFWDDFYRVHEIKWEQRKVHLDDLVAQENTVLTGIKFSRSNDNALQLEIQVTPFDFQTGKLDPSKTISITNPNDSERTEITMGERNLPQPNNYKYLSSEHNQFLKFAPSSLKDDVGQTVVPFIDLSDITTDMRTPLSGAGLIHQAHNPDSAGFLSFKLFNYNYAHHMQNS